MATLTVTSFGLVANNAAIGAANVTAFNSMLASATAGDTLYWPDGTYYFTVVSLRSMLVSKSVKFLGQSRAGTILKFAASATGGVGTTCRLLEVTASSVTIEGLTLHGNKPTNPGAFSDYDPNVEHHMGVFAGPDISDFTIKNCTITDFEGDGTQIYTGVTRPTIDTCTYQYCQRSGNSFTPTDGGNRPVRDAIVRYCTFHDIAGQPVDNEHGPVYGAQIYGNTFASGVNNYAVTCSGYATSAADELYGAPNRSRNWHIYGNTFGQAIFLIRCDDVLVDFNTWNNPHTKPCVDVSRSATNVTVNSNQMHMTQTTTASVACVSIIGTREDADGAGPLPPWYAYPTNIIVSNNLIDVTGHNLSFGVRAEAFDNITVVGNTIQGPATTGTFRGGVYLRATIPERDCVKAVVDRNTISKWGDCGITCNGNGAALIRRVQANKNTFFSLPKAMSFNADGTNAVRDVEAQGNLFGSGITTQIATLPNNGATISIGGSMATLIISGFGYTVYGNITDTGFPVAPDPAVVGVDHYMAGSAQKAAAWAAVTDANVKGRLLVDATRLLDGVRWAGEQTVPGQTLQWPRTGVTRADGTAVDPLYYPVEIVYACYELAYLLLLNPGLASDPTTTKAGNVASVGAGTAKVSFFRPLAGRQLPPSAWNLISMFVGGSAASGIGVGTSTGTDGTSSFDDDGDFYLTGQP